MENFNQIFTLLAETEGIGLNLDILETGLLNIIALCGILVYVGKDFLGSALEKRKSDIVISIQDAEERLNEANKRLTEAEKQLSQAQVVIAEIIIIFVSIILQRDSEEDRSKKKHAV